MESCKKASIYNMAESGPAAEFRPVELGGKNLPISDDPKDTASKKEQEPSSSQNAVPPYLMRKFFVARPGAFEQANEDLRNQILTKENETVNSAWLLAEVDHWNNEKERLVLITDKSLFICKYDFIMLCCQQIQKVPLNFIDKLCLGPFTFPERSLDKREGEGLRVHWDKLREPTFANRWNPFSEVLPYTTFIDHPLKSSSEKFSVICQISGFADSLIHAVEEAHKENPVPGRANGALVLKQPIAIETYVGLMSFIGNRNKLGYSLARGSVGF
uniref:Tumor protein p63 regulated 1 n=1 Tax=Xenopus tropicalis TaxID=8364 RepID=F6WYR8_XENTR